MRLKRLNMIHIVGVVIGNDDTVYVHGEAFSRNGEREPALLSLDMRSAFRLLDELDKHEEVLRKAAERREGTQ